VAAARLQLFEDQREHRPTHADDLLVGRMCRDLTRGGQPSGLLAPGLGELAEPGRDVLVEGCLARSDVNRPAWRGPLVRGLILRINSHGAIIVECVV